MLKKFIPAAIAMAILCGGGVASAATSSLGSADGSLSYGFGSDTLGRGSLSSISSDSAPLKAGDRIDIGQPILGSLGNFGKCSLGPIINKKQAITAVHCGDVGESLYHNLKFIGTIAKVSKHSDISFINLADDVNVVVNKINYAPMYAGQHIHKFGATTGESDGIVLDKVDVNYGLEGNVIVPMRESTMLTRKGDSGAAVYNDDNEVVGLVSAGMFPEERERTGHDYSYITPLSVKALGR